MKVLGQFTLKLIIPWHLRKQKFGHENSAGLGAHFEMIIYPMAGHPDDPVIADHQRAFYALLSGNLIVYEKFF